MTETEEKEQKVLYELIRTKERVKELEESNEKEEKKLNKKTEEYEQKLEEIRKEEEEKRKRIMELHSKKIAALNAQLGSLKTSLEKQQAAIKLKTDKERRLIEEFSDKIKEISKIEEMKSFDKIIQEAPKVAIAEEIGEEEEEAIMKNNDFYERITAKPAPPFDAYEGSQVEDLIPMIEIASQHGETADKIRNTLRNSGYQEKDIEAAFSSLGL